MSLKEIYIIYSVDIRAVSKDDLKLKFDYYKKNYNKPDISFDRFIELMISWNKYPYEFTITPEGYYEYLMDAKCKVENNVYDINEGGCFPYAVIASLPLNCLFPNTFGDRDFLLFEYNKKENKYFQTEWNDDKFVKLLDFAKHGGM